MGKTDSSEIVSDIDEELLKREVANGNESCRIKYEYSTALAMLSKFGLCNTETKV